MSLLGVNFVGVIAAAIASFLFGAVWYTGLQKQWLEARGLSDEAIKAQSAGRPPMLPMIIAFVSQLVMAYVLAGVLWHIGKGNPTLRGALISAAFVWAGFIATTLATNHAFQGQKRALTLIDGGYWLGVLTIQAVVLALAGVK